MAEREKCEKDEVYQRGVKGTNFKTRTIQECLNCKRPACTGCPIGEVEIPNNKVVTR